MHPTKAKFLASLDASSASVDRVVRCSFRALASPGKHGPVDLGFALAVVPLWALSAILGDVTYVMISRTDDALWDRLPPLDSPSE